MAQGFRSRIATRRTLASALVAVGVAAVLVAVVWRRRDEFAEALGSASLGVLLAATALQLVALLARTDAWHVCVRAAGGTLGRRRLYRAAGIGYLGSQLNAQVGTAARIAALRRTSPGDSPRVGALVAAEVPIVVVEGAFGALAAFTLVGPLGLPWWAPVVGFLVAVVAGLVLRRVCRGHQTGWRTGLAVLRSMQGRNRVIGLMTIAICAQIARNWLTLHAVGVDASVFDAAAVLIAIAVIAQLPVGPSTGPAAVVLVLGSGGIAAAAAAGVLLTATGCAGALVYVAWAGGDLAWTRRRDRRRAGTAPVVPGVAPRRAEPAVVRPAP